jgi:hypothetical protein
MPHGNAEREQRLSEALVACLEALEEGRTPEELLGRYPEFAAELKRFFARQAEMDHLVGSLLRDLPVVDAVLLPRETASPSMEGGEGRSRSLPEVPLGSFGHYELVERIGQGGTGLVYKARQPGLHRFVALKMLRGGGRAAGADVARFRREAEMVADLDHPHIVPIYEVGEWREESVNESLPYFSMKLMEGGSLKDRLRHFVADPASAARLLIPVARAVHHAHQRGILHRDLKPSNILLDAAGRPHVSDFGLAKRLERDISITGAGELVGTPHYMAPEQASGDKGAVTVATDVHGLGTVLYALLTGRPPFDGGTILDTLEQVRNCEPVPPSATNPRVDRDLETICLKCLHKEPAQRYADARALAEDLERYQAGKPIQARPAGLAERLWRWCRRRPTIAVLTVVLAVVVAAGLMALLCPQTKPRRQFIVDLAGPATQFFLAPLLIAGLWLLVQRGRVLADQDLAEALRQKAKAEARAWRAERRRRRAEHTLEELCRAVSHRLTRLSEMEVRAEPGIQEQHKQLLAEVRADFRGYLPQGPGGPFLQAYAAEDQRHVGLLTGKRGAMGGAPERKGRPRCR